jgi:hypothetical protein
MTTEPIRIGLDEITDAMDASFDHSSVLDTLTGHIMPANMDLLEFGANDPETEDLEDDALEEAMEERFADIPTVGAPAGIALRERFIETVQDDELQFRLRDALRGRGAFAHFRDLLGEEPDERNRFIAFRAAELKAQVKEWLDDLGIEYELVEPTAPAPRAEPTKPAVDVTLLDVLVLGAPGGKTELVEGWVPRFLPAKSRELARHYFRHLAREACVLSGTSWRKRFIDGKDEVEFGRLKLRVEDDGVWVGLSADLETWDRFEK